MSNFKVLPLILFGTIFLAACSPKITPAVTATAVATTEQPPVINTSDWPIHQYENTSIRYPLEGVLQEDHNTGIALLAYFIFLDQTPATNGFKENLNLAIESNIPTSFNLESYADAGMNIIKNMASNFEPEYREVRQHNGQEYLAIAYTGQLATAGDRQLYWYQNYWLKNGTAYVLTFTCLNDNSFSSFSDKVEAVFRSFKIGKPKEK